MIKEIRINNEGYFRILKDVKDYPNEPIFDIEQVIPFLKYLSFQWEKDYTPFSFIKFLHNYYFICPLITIIYLLFCKYGKVFLNNRKPLNLKHLMMVWNLLLSLINTLVVIRLLPVLAYIIYHYSLTGLLTIPPIYFYAYGSVGLWITIFIMSKYFELIDTCFLIFRKKTVTLLHWYHHCTVLLYTWDTYFVELPAGVVFIFINGFVHSIMYFYYFLSLYYKNPLRWSIIVTIIQIIQIIIGIFLTIYCLYISIVYEYSYNWDRAYIQAIKGSFSYSNGHYISRRNICYACIMYLSYLYLFAKYFIGRYVSKRVKKEDEINKKKTKMY